MTIREVGILTSSKVKVEEISTWFQLYGIHVRQILPNPQNTMDLMVQDYLNSSTSDHKILAILQEQTHLYKRGTTTPADKTPLELVEHVSIMTVYTHTDQLNFSSVTRGYIDLTRQNNILNKYDWDDIFVVDRCHKSYVELSQSNLKISSRDKNISKVIENLIHYKKMVDLVHNPQKYIQVIDFTRDPYDYLTKIPEFNMNPDSNLVNLNNFLTEALNQGVFFRSVKTRREKLYWCPGLNAGIPFTPKPKDPRHELTYQMHDFCHFTIPDLVFDRMGKTVAEEALRKKVYITYRLMSEAITLVMADMIFIYQLTKNGQTYETVNQRKIYPIFEAMLRKNKNVNLYEVLRGSYEYCFYKDTSRWSGLMDDPLALEAFSGKYDAYFMDDFKWTLHNYEDMVRRSGSLTQWWNRVQKWRQQGANLKLQSISEFMGTLKLNGVNQRELLDSIFEQIYHQYIQPLCQETSLPLFSREDRLRNGFLRYWMGQCLIFSQFDAYPESQLVWNQIQATISQYPINLTLIQNLRQFYHNYLNKLEEANLITPDDNLNFSEIYPIFNPMIVSYEAGQILNQEFVNQILN